MGYSVKYDPIQNSLKYQRHLEVKEFECTAGQTTFQCDVDLNDDYVFLVDGNFQERGHSRSGINVIYSAGLPAGTLVTIVY